MKTLRKNLVAVALLAAAVTFAFSAPVAADQKINDDLIVCGSLCVGIDCVNGESFGFDTIRLKENNLRIRFFDTSSSASFPTRDWQLTANDSSNGGANKFSIDNIDDGRTPFTILDGASSHSLFVDAQGDVGLTTSTPVVELHIVDGDTPTMRLEQDGSSGFTPQTWDVAGNETNFFIRDVTNGSKLPFKIRPNTAADSLVMEDGGAKFQTANVMIGSSSDPDASLHVSRTDATAEIHIQDTGAGNQQMLHLEKTQNAPFVRFTSAFGDWDFVAGGNFSITDPAVAGNQLTLTRTGDLTVTGNCTEVDGACADYVFEPGYEYLSLPELKTFITENQHLPNVPSTADIQENGLNIQKMSGRMLEKIEELVLYTLEQQEEIDRLKQENAQLSELQERLSALESRVN